MLLNSPTRNRFNKDALLLCILPTFAVLVAMVGVSLWVWVTAKQDLRRDRDTLIEQHLSDVQALITTRMKSYEEVMRSTAALIESTDAVTPEDLHSIIGTYEIEKRFPGVRALGYAPVVSNDNLAAFTESVRANGQTDFTVTPEGTRSTYIPIQYVEPKIESNVAAIGFDMYSDATRKTAFDLATRKSEVVITGKINPRPGTTPIPGGAFQMYFPVYDSGCTQSATARASCRLTGFIIASFRADELMEKLLSSAPSIKDDFTVYDGTDLSSSHVMFKTPGYKDASASSVAVVNVYSRTWSIAVQVSQEALNAQLRTKPTLILIAGLVLSISSSAFIYILLLQRVRSLQQAKETEVQMVKDDLLALAAHQLRTPATAVKQYIIMALEGYGGDLSKNQKQLIKKAFDNNERQLRTVNEMLYVANADAGKLRLIPRSVDLVQLVHEAIEEHRAASNEKRHRLEEHLPSTPLYYDADELYLRMAVSNLISNAIKYTPEAGKITVRLKITPRSIHISGKDNGVGISKKQMPDLFKKFSRLDNPLSVHAMGNGLGLYLARRVVELHKGRIKVASEHTIGSEFTIVLPRPKTEDPTAGSRKKVTKEE